ncbi:hypothetical protein LCGC14_1808060 [marine sediment metagenome]|uniref:Uncharacterized protein n=1 Tax=marine sediment metagenome TaxID=412755 RepID=A0A0F9J296_9ZZZZ
MSNTNKEITESWKKKSNKTWKIKLASGMDVIVKRPAWISLLKMGMIPNRLFNLVMDQEANIAKAQTNGTKPTLDPKESAEIMQGYAVAACVVPKVVLADPKSDEISVEDIDDDDLVEIFTKVQKLLAFGEEGEGKALENFREGGTVVDTGHTGPTVSHKAVDVSPNR